MVNPGLVLIDVGDGTLIPILPAPTKPPSTATPKVAPPAPATTSPVTPSLTPPLADQATDAYVPSGVNVPTGQFGQNVQVSAAQTTPQLSPTASPGPTTPTIATTDPPLTGATALPTQPTSALAGQQPDFGSDAYVPAGVHVREGYLGQNVTLTHLDTEVLVPNGSPGGRTLQSTDELPPVVIPAPRRPKATPAHPKPSMPVKLEVPIAGRSGKFTITPPQSRIKVSVGADATLSWSRGRGKLGVHFDPKTSAVSLTNGPLTVTDPGHLRTAIEDHEATIKNEVARALRLPISRIPTETTTKHRIVPRGERLPTVQLSVGHSTTVHVPLLPDVSITTTTRTDGNEVKITVKVSTAFSQELRGYGEIKSDYSITAEAVARLDQKKRSRGLSPEEIEVIALLATAIVVVGRVYVGTGSARKR